MSWSRFQRTMSQQKRSLSTLSRYLHHVAIGVERDPWPVRQASVEGAFFHFRVYLLVAFLAHVFEKGGVEVVVVVVANK